MRANAKLAEGPRWDALGRRLLWVDIEGCRLHIFENGEDRAIGLDAMVGAAAPTSLGTVLVALADRLALVDLADESVQALVPLPHGPNVRANDGACDAAGRFWIGTMGLDDAPGAGALYRYDGGLERVLDGVTLSNGLGWARDHSLMYYIDSPSYRVDVFDFELASGRVASRRPFVSIDESDGTPDGLAIDDEGGIWVALYGGSCVRRYDENGRLDAVSRRAREERHRVLLRRRRRPLALRDDGGAGRKRLRHTTGIGGSPADVFHAGGTRTAPSDAEETSAR